jgi:hypothetical protein
LAQVFWHPANVADHISLVGHFRVVVTMSFVVVAVGFVVDFVVVVGLVVGFVVVVTFVVATVAAMTIARFTTTIVKIKNFVIFQKTFNLLQFYKPTK